jgi:hypothetical protein
MKMIAKHSIKGDCVDMIGDYILTASGASFYGYEYEPKATVRIYRLSEKQRFYNKCWGETNRYSK